jgi:hypothetical protein
MSADNGKTFLAQNAHHGGEYAIVAGKERGPPDAGQNSRALGVWPQIEKGWPPHRPNQHKLPAPVLPEKTKDAACGAKPDEIMRIGANDGGICEILESNYVNMAAAAPRRLCNLTGQRPTTRQYSQRFLCHAHKNLAVGDCT